MHRVKIPKKKKVEYGRYGKKEMAIMMLSARKGIPFHIFEDFVNRSPFAIDEWYSFLHFPKRTAQRHTKERRTFDTPTSDRILQLTLFFDQGAQVFHDMHKFGAWMHTPLPALGNRKPKEFMDTTFGMGLVQDELAKI